MVHSVAHVLLGSNFLGKMVIPTGTKVPRSTSVPTRDKAEGHLHLPRAAIR